VAEAIDVVVMASPDEPAYSAFVRNGERTSSIYHSLEWRDVLTEAFGYEPHYLIAKSEGQVTGVLPLMLVPGLLRGTRLVSLPFSHSVPLCAAAGSVGPLIDSATMTAQSRSSGRLEIRADTDVSGLVVSSPFVDTRLQLDDPASLWASISASTRRGVRKAERAGIEVSAEESLDQFREFEGMVVETRQSQGVPTYPVGFFKSMRKHLGNTGLARLYLAWKNEQPIAGMVMTYWRNSAIYAYGASTRHREMLNMRPNNLLFWQAIRDAAADGYSIFDFGTTHASNEGLLRFKQGWGATTTPLSYAYSPALSGSSPREHRSGLMFNLAAHCFRHMPHGMYRRLSDALTPRLG